MAVQRRPPGSRSAAAPADPTRVARANARSSGDGAVSVTMATVRHPGVAQGQHRRVGDVLGARPPRPDARPASRARHHPLLQLARREHAGRAVPRDQPGGAGPLAGPGGQQHRTGAHRPRCRPARPASTVPSSARSVTVVESRIRAPPSVGPARQLAGVGGSGQRTVQVLEAEPGVVAVPGHPTGAGLPVDHHDGTDAPDAQLVGGSQPGRAGPHHQDGGTAHRGTRVSTPGSRARLGGHERHTSAPHQLPWHRPFMARVRRRTAPRSAAASGPWQASRTSPRSPARSGRAASRRPGRRRCARGPAAGAPGDSPSGGMRVAPRSAAEPAPRGPGPSSSSATCSGHGQRGGQPGRPDPADGHVPLSRRGCGSGSHGARWPPAGRRRRRSPLRRPGRAGCARPAASSASMPGRGGRRVRAVRRGPPRWDRGARSPGRRRHQHPLGPLGRHRQEDPGHQPPGQLVEHDELSPTGRDREVVVAEQGVDAVGAEAGGVDQPPGPDHPPGTRTSWPAARGHRSVPASTAAGGPRPDGLGGEGQRHRPRVDDPLAGHRQAHRGRRARGGARGLAPRPRPPARRPPYPLASALARRPAARASCSSSQATSRAPVRSRAMPAAPA